METRLWIEDLEVVWTLKIEVADLRARIYGRVIWGHGLGLDLAVLSWLPALWAGWRGVSRCSGMVQAVYAWLWG